MKPLPLLQDWTDTDIAAHALAIHLGLVAETTPLSQAKHIYWATNPLGEFLFATLQGLVRLGALEYDAEEQRFRWNPQFDDTAATAARRR